MKDYIQTFEAMLDKQWLSEHILNLYRIERKQTFPAYQKAADYVYDLLKSEGFAAELLNFPADGKTVYQDKCSPIGWDVSTMKLTLLTPVAGISDPVISDYEKEPLFAIKHSVSTPPGGITANLVTEAQMKAGENVAGAFVLLNQATYPRKDVIRMLLDLGAIGWVSDFLEEPHTTPDCVSWTNAGTEYNSWHVQAGDRDFISFQVTPRTGLALRAACESGPVLVHALSDGRRYETEIPAVTGLLPGEDPREVWIVSHLYEPLVDDNANGVIGSVGILKLLRQLAGQHKLKYSVRVVFAAEMYGFAAVAEHFGGDLSGRVIGCINTDGLTSSFEKAKHKIYLAKEAPDLPGFAGNVVLNCVTDQLLKNRPDFTVTESNGSYGDDCFLSDATIGCPTVWIKYMIKGGYHHNSWLDETVFDVDSAVLHLSYSAAWVRAMADMDAQEVRQLLPAAVNRANRVLENAAKQTVRPGTDEKMRMEFLFHRECSKLRQLTLWGDAADIEAAIRGITLPESACTVEDMAQPWYDYTENFIFRRLQRGFPHDLIKLPREKRKPMPGSILYNTIADLVSRMDGKKTMRRLIDETEWNSGVLFDEKTVQAYLHTFTMLADAGYFQMEVKNPLTAAALTEALRALGVKEGDTLLVHSALSGLGYLSGGADAAITALRRSVGETGTFLAPAFTRPYTTFAGRLNKDYRYRPYDTRPDGAFRDKSISTGTLPKAMLRHPDACRSGHATHEWVALGADAAACVSEHGLLDSPTGETSPLKKALDRKGSVVFLGCGINANTFLHYAEATANAAYLQEAVIRHIDSDGTWRTALIPQHLPGHRSFYQGISSEFYREALRRGLQIHSQPFGMATLYRMELSQLYRIAMEMFAEDSCATLCSDPNCTFCRSFRK